MWLSAIKKDKNIIKNQDHQYFSQSTKNSGAFQNRYGCRCHALCQSLLKKGTTEAYKAKADHLERHNHDTVGNWQSNIEFTVVRKDYTCLLDHKTFKELDCVTINEEKFAANEETVLECEFGDLSETHLKVDPSIKPWILPTGRYHSLSSHESK